MVLRVNGGKKGVILGTLLGMYVPIDKVCVEWQSWWHPDGYLCDYVACRAPTVMKLLKEDITPTCCVELECAMGEVLQSWRPSEDADAEAELGSMVKQFRGGRAGRHGEAVPDAAIEAC